MPSFLSKVFGRKKDDKDSSPANQLGPGELLGGKFEAVSPNVSPNAVHYLELQSDTVPAPDAEEKDFGLPFFRTKSRPSSPEVKPKRLFDALPPLSLDFDLKDKSAYNGYIFEESNSEAIFPDNVLGQRRLNPMEALVLIRACSKAIISRGLETLGIMTPHWYSTSPDAQRRLISNFLRSLDSTTSAAAAIPSSPYITNFDDEINFTRSIHDVAAVLRWALRHIQLEGDNLGTNDGWYKAFFDAEAANGYPPKAFSEKLAPSLPASHLDLVVSTLELFSSLAAFSEANGTSGSRLSKIFGLWLLAARRVEDKDDWRTLYARWERTGRMLEHLFLARVRDQSTDQRMPTRLLDLVRMYPFTQGLSSPTTDLQLLPYPQFTTALHPALFVRVQYEVTSQERIPKTKINPSVLLADAFSTKVEEGEFVELWAKITSAASKAGSELPLGNVLANESLRLLSLFADKPKEEVKSPTLSVISLIEPRLQRAASNGAASFSLLKPNTESAPLTTTATLSPLGGDWEQFSASGFLGIDQTFPPLVSTLFDTDIEKTEPRDIPLPISRKPSKRAVRKSLELPRSVVIAESSTISSPDSSNLKSSGQEVITASQFEVVELDEAFVDFWSDTLLDPIASNWPTFVVCKFKPSLVPDLTYGTGDEKTKKTLKWLILEQVYSVKPRPVPSSPLPKLPTSAETSARPASPIAQTPTGRRLFNFWSMSRTPSSSSTGSQKARKTPKTPRVGEMGELIEEGDDKLRSPSSKMFKSLDLGVRRSGGKKSEEKTKSIDVARPEISVTSPTDVDARATSSTIVAASAVAAVATTTAVRLATEKQEANIVKEVDLPTVPEAVAEISDPVLVSESSDDASRQDFVPVEVEVPLDDAEVQDAQIVDAGAPAVVAIASLPETTIVGEEPQAEEPTKGEGIEEDTVHYPQEVDRSFLVSAAPTSVESNSNQLLPPEVELPVRQTEEVEDQLSISHSIVGSDKPLLDEVTVHSEEHQAPLITEDEGVEISEASGEELGRLSEKPNFEGVEEGALESLTEVAMTTVVSAVPEVETEVTEPDTKINEPVDEGISEEVPPVEVAQEVVSTLQDADEVPATVAEEVGTETPVPMVTAAEPAPIVDGPIVVDEAPALEAYPELDEREEASIAEVSKPATEVVPSVEDAGTNGVSLAVEEMEAGELLVDGVPAPGDSSSADVNRVEEVVPAAVVEVPPTLDDASTPAQPAEELSVSVPQEVSDHSLEVRGAAAVEDEAVVEADVGIETFSEEIGALSAEPAMDESQAQEVVEIAVEEPEPSVTPVEIVTPRETAEKLPAESVALEQLTTEHPVEDSRDIGVVGESTLADEAPVHEGVTNVEERSQEARAVEPEQPVEVANETTVGAGVPEIQEATTDEVPVSGSSNEDAREIVASEDAAPVETLLETPSFAIEASKIPPAETTSEESSEQPTADEPASEAVPTAEEPSQELLVPEEETPTQLETEETPLIESPPPIDEPHEESAFETKLSEELPATEPELLIEEPETVLEIAPIEVLQVVEEPNATNEAPLEEDATLAEAAVSDEPGPEVILSTSEVPDAGGASIPEEETQLEVPERALGSALPTSEDAQLEIIPFAKPPSMPLADDEVTTTSEEGGVAEEIPVAIANGIGVVERTSINESDASESVTASVPEVSGESPSVAEEAVTAEEPVASAITEPTLGEVPPEAQAVTEAVPDVPEVVEEAPAIVEEVDDADVDDPINVAEHPRAVDEPDLSADEASEQPTRVSVEGSSPTPIVETIIHEPLPLGVSPFQESLPAETSPTAQAISETTEDTRPEESLASQEPVDNAEVSAAVEQPFEESLPGAVDAEKATLTSIPLEEGVSPLVDQIPPVSEGSPILVEETFDAVRTVPDAVEAVSVPVDEMPPVIPDAEQRTAMVTDETLASVEASLEVGPQPDTEIAAEPAETSPAASEPPAERGDNICAIPAPVEISADINQPMLSQEVEHPGVEGRIIDEPTVESAARDHSSLEKPDEPTIPDVPVTASPSDFPNEPSEEGPAHLDNQNKAADAYSLDPTPASIPEKGLDQTSPPSISSVAELDGVPAPLAEPSPESADPALTEQSDPTDSEGTDELPAIPEHINIAPIGANDPAILEEVDEVPAFVEEISAIAESSGEPLLEEPDLTSELPTGAGHMKITTEATDTTIVAPVAVSAASEANTALEKLEDSTGIFI